MPGTTRSSERCEGHARDHLLEHHIDDAGRVLRAGFAREIISRILERFPGALAYASVVTASRFVRSDAVHVTVRGPSVEAETVQAMAAEVRAVRRRSPFALGLSFVDHEEPSVLVCRGQICTAPLTSLETLRDALASPRRAG